MWGVAQCFQLLMDGIMLAISLRKKREKKPKRKEKKNDEKNVYNKWQEKKRLNIGLIKHLPCLFYY